MTNPDPACLDASMISQPSYSFFPDAFQTMAQPPLWDSCPVADLCPTLSASGAVLPLQPGIFSVWKGWVFPAAESMGSAWMGAEGTIAHFGLLLDLLLDGKLHSLPFLSWASHCMCSWPRIKGAEMTSPSLTSH